MNRTILLGLSIMSLLLLAGSSSADLTVNISGVQNSAIFEVSYSPALTFTFMQNNSFANSTQEQLANLFALNSTVIPVSSNSPVFYNLNDRIKAVNNNLYVTNLTFSEKFNISRQGKTVQILPYFNYTYALSNIIQANAITVNWLNVTPLVSLSDEFANLPQLIKLGINESYNLTSQSGDQQLAGLTYSFDQALDATTLKSSNPEAETVFSNASLIEILSSQNLISIQIPGQVHVEGNEILFYSIPGVSSAEIILLSIGITAISMIIILMLIKMNLSKN